MFEVLTDDRQIDRVLKSTVRARAQNHDVGIYLFGSAGHTGKGKVVHCIKRQVHQFADDPTSGGRSVVRHSLNPIDKKGYAGARNGEKQNAGDNCNVFVGNALKIHLNETGRGNALRQRQESLVADVLTKVGAFWAVRKNDVAWFVFETDVHDDRELWGDIQRALTSKGAKFGDPCSVDEPHELIPLHPWADRTAVLDESSSYHENHNGRVEDPNALLMRLKAMKQS